MIEFIEKYQAVITIVLGIIQVLVIIIGWVITSKIYSKIQKNSGGVNFQSNKFNNHSGVNIGK